MAVAKFGSMDSEKLKNVVELKGLKEELEEQTEHRGFVWHETQNYRKCGVPTNRTSFVIFMQFDWYKLIEC